MDAKAARLLSEMKFPEGKLRVIDKRKPYADYLREVAKHKIVLQLDRSRVPGQVAGDALLCRTICVGGDGAIERIAFPAFCGDGRTFEQLHSIALELLKNTTVRAHRPHGIAMARDGRISPSVPGESSLENFFSQLANPSFPNINPPISDLGSTIEFLRDRVGAGARDSRKKMSILRRVEQGARKRFVIAFRHEHTAHAILDRFRNAAVLGREHRQAARHRFEHRVRNAFLISIASGLAWMKKNMRCVKNLAQFFLRNRDRETKLDCRS